MSCVCPLAGYCERHDVDKPEHWHTLCQTKPKYFQAWEEGRGPGQVFRTEADMPQPRRPRKGPGTELSLILDKMGYKLKAKCSCKSRMQRMNTWGIEGCRANINEITDWLVEAASEAGWLERFAVTVPGARNLARRKIEKLIVEAIDAAEKAENHQKDQGE